MENLALKVDTLLYLYHTLPASMWRIVCLTVMYGHVLFLNTCSLCFI